MILARAPLRISFGGGGTDLPSYYAHHGGFVVSAAIDKYVYIYANRPAADDLLHIKYSRYEEVSSPDEIQHDLVRPSLKLLGIHNNLDIASMADIPAGTGLGSSSTYLVALLTALLELQRKRISTHELAELACHVEMDLARHAVGKQDHYLAAYGGITRLDINCSGEVQVTPVEVSLSCVEQLRSRLLLFFTGMTRSAAIILESQHNDTVSGDANVLDSLHHTKKLGHQVYEALRQGDLDAFGLLMHDHWENKKRRSGQISDARIDRWYNAARSAGALGGKIVGAGGGGFLMLYCPDAAKPAVRAVLAAEGLREMPFAFDFEGAKVLVNF